MKLPSAKSAATLGCLALLAMAPAPSQEPQADDPRMQPGAPHTSNLVIGETAPAFALESIDGETYDLAAQRGQRPILLLFFRGAW